MVVAFLFAIFQELCITGYVPVALFFILKAWRNAAPNLFKKE